MIAFHNILRTLVRGMLLTAFIFVSATALLAGSAPRSDGEQTPYREYGPHECGPLAILSPGFGGTERGLVIYANALAAAGFRVYVIGHLQSGPVQLRAVVRSANWRRALKKAVSDPKANDARQLDLDAVWAIATADCAAPFTVMLGHSMGAQATLIEAGAAFHSGLQGKDRFDAYVALSPQGVGDRFAQGAWQGIGKPVLMVTGTRDGEVNNVYKNRLTAFEGLPAGNKRLAVLKGATHKHIGGRGSGPSPALVRSIILEFLNAVRKDHLPAAMKRPGVTFTDK